MCQTLRDSEDPNQTARILRLTWAFAVRICPGDNVATPGNPYSLTRAWRALLSAFFQETMKRRQVIHTVWPGPDVYVIIFYSTE